MTDNERLLLLLVADALRNAPSVSLATRQRIAAARHAMDDEAHAARQFTPQGAVVLTGPRYQEDTLDAASDAHSPGTGRVG